jgi:hypothetical protein
LRLKKIMPVAILIFLFSFTLAIGLSQARSVAPTATDCTLQVQDAAGHLKVKFAFQEQVYLSWLADGTIDIQVKPRLTGGGFGDSIHSLYSAGTADPEGSNNYIGNDNFMPPAPGRYAVIVNGVDSETIEIDSFTVLPESAFGALTAIGACFAAIGTIAVVKQKFK